MVNFTIIIFLRISLVGTIVASKKKKTEIYNDIFFAGIVVPAMYKFTNRDFWIGNVTRDRLLSTLWYKATQSPGVSPTFCIF